jgi:hypothetical protein
VYDEPATTRPSHDPVAADDQAAPTFDPSTYAPIADAGHAAPPTICPFLRAIDQVDRLDQAVEAPDQANRCTAIREPVPQSLRQQELVCLTSGHVNCPRYLRGSVGLAEIPVAVAVDRRVTMTPAITGALAIFVAAFLVSTAFLFANGGLTLSAAGPSPTASGDVLGAVETEAPTPVPTVKPTVEPTPSAAPRPTPGLSPATTATPTPTPLATPGPSPTVQATPTPKPRSDRYVLLRRCPDRSNCWIYVIRSGDNLYSIANYFGVSLKTVRAWNGWTESGLNVGRELRIPTPTR